jgi:two-component system response regulator YesN
VQNSELQKLAFLVVDDDDDFLTVLTAMLRALGVSKITTARTGSDALTKLMAVQHRVDCILCDLKMPSGNGLQLLKALRTGRIRAMRPDACFIFITASGESAHIQTALRLDVNGYVVKPVTREKMQAAITRGRAKAFAVDVKQYEAVVVPDQAT